MSKNLQYHLILVRHAKSSWAYPGMEDIDRPLNERGQKDAPEMGKFLANKHLKCRQILCSPAVRTQKTLELLGHEWDLQVPVEYPESLYLPSPEILLSLCRKFSANLPLMVIAHNPGITEFANQLCSVEIDNVPTMGVCLVRLKNPPQIDFGDAELVDFYRPKALFN
jgi:phosphohistidine phosphatase